MPALLPAAPQQGIADVAVLAEHVRPGVVDEVVVIGKPRGQGPQLRTEDDVRGVGAECAKTISAASDSAAPLADAGFEPRPAAQPYVAGTVG
jgi:hypothetical protein